jgi:hypothetical protein
MENRDQILLDVFAKAGGVSSLANKLGISRAAVYCWKKVPTMHIKAISELTSIPRKKLRPDLYD